MTPEEQARLLARWLDHPDEPVADGLDEDVVEAVVALRPELAPPPRVTPDEILDLVSAGPLSASAPVVDEAPVAPEVEAEATPETTAEVVAFPTRRWGRWAAGGVVGLMAAAAALVIVAVPGALFLTGQDEQLAAAPPATSTPMAEAARKDASPLPVEQAWLDDDAVADLGEVEKSEERLGSLGYVQPAPELVAKATRPAGGATSSSVAGRELIPEVHTTATAEVAYDAVADLDLEVLDEADEDFGPVAMAPEPTVTAGSKEAYDLDDAVAMEDLEEPEADYVDEDLYGDVAVSESVTVARSPRGRAVREAKAKRRDRPASSTRGGARADKSAAPVRMEEELADTEAEEVGFGRGGSGTATASDAPAPPPADLPSLRAAAMPTDYTQSSMGLLDGTTRAGLEASQDAATQLASERRFGEAGDTLAAHIAPPPEVGMDQAARAALYYANAGDPASAVAACQAGLALSMANTPARSYLLVIYGDALRQSGDTLGAAAAYHQAISLNEGRSPSNRYYDAIESAAPADR